MTYLGATPTWRCDMDRRRVTLYALGVVTVVGTTLIPETSEARRPDSPPAERPSPGGKGDKGGNEKAKPCRLDKLKHCSSL